MFPRKSIIEILTPKFSQSLKTNFLFNIGCPSTLRLFVSELWSKQKRNGATELGGRAELCFLHSYLCRLRFYLYP